MRNLYPNGKPKFSASMKWKAMSLILGLLVLTSFVHAQVAQTWTGTTSNNFRVEDNWDPLGSPAGNNLTLPLIQYDKEGKLISPNDVSPVLSGSEDLKVGFIYMTGTTADTMKMRNLTINLDPKATFTSSSGNAINYTTVNLVLNSGKVYFDNYERFQENYRNWTINGGELYCARSSRTMQIGNANTPTSGGQFFVNGGLLYIRGGGLGRAFYTREGGQFIIKGNGVVKMDGDKRSFQQYIESGWINGGDEYYPVLSFDPVSNVTTFTVVPVNTVMFRPTETQELLAGTTANVLYMVLTPRVKTAKSISWKYRKDGETTFTTFAGADSTSFAPKFDTGGVFHVVAEIVDAADAVVKTNEVTFSVISDDITTTPAFSVQYIRNMEAGTKITATFKDNKVPTAMEWKYSDAISGTYVSFNPAQKTASIIPVFNLDSAATGKSYYMLLEATIDGKVIRSANVKYIVEYQKNSGKVINWTGLVSDNGNDPGNYSPVAGSFKNAIVVPVVASGVYPVFRGTGSDSLHHFQVNDKATLTFDGPDHIYVGGGGLQPYVDGDVYLKKGEMRTVSCDTLVANKGYFNIRYGTSDMFISGNAVLRVNTLLMGNANSPAHGGRLHLSDNAKVYAIDLGRVLTKRSDSSVVYLSDNAMFYHYGDVRTKLNTYADSAKFKCAAEGYAPYVVYDGTWTYVKARNTKAFAIADDSRTFTTAGYPVDKEIGLANTDGITSWEWKYSTSVYGPWKSFSPALKDAPSVAPVFAEAGNYYIVAESSTGVLTSNMKLVSVINLAATPSNVQVKAVGSKCDTLFVTIPTEVTLLSGAWFITDADGNEIETGVKESAYLPSFSTPGIYEVFYLAEVQDEKSVSYSLFSNKVTIYYGVDRKLKVGYYSFSKTGMDATAAKPDADPVYTMLKADEKLDVTLELLTDVSATATTNVSKYDVIVIQESFGGGDKILTPAGALGIAKLNKPTLYNKSYAFKAGRAFATGATGAGAELTASVLHLKVPAANQGNPLFKGLTFAGDSVKVLNIGATDLGANGTKTLNYAKDVVISDANTLLGVPVRVSGTDVPVISFNDIPKGTTFGGETTAARMITFGMNFGAICNHNGTNLTSAGITLWRNAVYMLGGLDVPATLVKGNDDGFAGFAQTELTGVRVYPNPARTFVNVDGLNSQSLVKVINAAGQVVFSRSANSQSMRISTEGFNPGVYMLRVENNGKVLSSKFLKQ